MYKMPRAKSTFARGDSGVGRIRFYAEGKGVQVIIRKYDGTEKTYGPIPLDSCPKNILQVKAIKKKATEEKRPEVEWFIQMSADNDEIQNFRPANGYYLFRSLGFSSSPGKEPTIRNEVHEGKSKDGKPYTEEYQYCYAMFEIVEPKEFAGMTVTDKLRSTGGRPMFASAIQPDGKTVLIFGASGKHVDHMEEYLFVSGWLSEKYQPVEYSDNPLPDIQRVILYEDRLFHATLKDGWIVPNTMSAANMPDEETDDDLPWQATPGITTTPAPAFEASDEIPFTPVSNPTEPDEEADFVD